MISTPACAKRCFIEDSAPRLEGFSSRSIYPTQLKCDLLEICPVANEYKPNTIGSRTSSGVVVRRQLTSLFLNSWVSIRAKWHRTRLSMSRNPKLSIRDSSDWVQDEFKCEHTTNPKINAFSTPRLTESNSVSNTEVYVLLTDRSRKNQLDFCSPRSHKKRNSFPINGGK